MRAVPASRASFSHCTIGHLCLCRLVWCAQPTPTEYIPLYTVMQHNPLMVPVHRCSISRSNKEHFNVNFTNFIAKFYCQILLPSISLSISFYYNIASSSIHTNCWYNTLNIIYSKGGVFCRQSTCRHRRMPRSAELFVHKGFVILHKSLVCSMYLLSGGDCDSSSSSHLLLFFFLLFLLFFARISYAEVMVTLWYQNL